jgi:hypothetical protein
VAIALSAADAGGPGPASGLAATYLDGTSYSGARIITTEGSSAHTFYSVDAAGNTEGTQSVTIKIDTVLPATTASLSGLMGQASWFVSPITVTLSAIDSTSGVGSITLDSATYSAPRIYSGQGTTNITYRATDNAGNQEFTQNASFKIDTVTPVSAFTSHTNGKWVNQVITLGGGSTDATSGLASVAINIANSGWVAPTGTSTWTKTWDTRAVADGSYVIQARGTDNAGNVEGTATLTLNVDNTSPTMNLEVNCPAQGDNGWCKAAVNVRLNAADAGSGVASIIYDYNNETKTIHSTGVEMASGVGGVSTINVYALDNLNQRSETKSAQIKIDGAPPTIQLAGADSHTLNVSVSDTQAGIAKWSLQVLNPANQSVLWNEATGAYNGLINWNNNDLPAGTYTVQIFARDNAGHEQSLRSSFNVAANNAVAFVAPTPIPTATPLPRIIVNIQPTKIPTPTQAATAIAQLPNNPPVQPPPSNVEPPQFVTIKVPPKIYLPPTSAGAWQWTVPLLAMALGAIATISLTKQFPQTQGALGVLIAVLV